jgi:oxygen-independent coproporphyrinogen-3 oxidase
MNKICNVYIHVPFCQSKCDYCAFYSLANPNKAQVNAYFERLKSEIAAKKDALGHIETLFIGGGTPSIFAEKDLVYFLKNLQQLFTFAHEAECTMECNPESLTTEKIDIISDSFINRVSLGVQSFHPHLRERIGRKGNLNNLQKNIVRFAQSGIENISFDLIYGIPGETLNDLTRDITEALAYPIHHLSAYALTIEKSSRLRTKNKAILNNDDLEAEMWEEIGSFLQEKSGMHRYEISNYAQEGFECRHNLSFWNGNTYQGFGPAAVSFTGNERIKNAEHFEAWLQNKNQEREELTLSMRARELMILSMRMPLGIEESFFEEKMGCTFSEMFGKEIEALSREKLVIYDGERLVPTAKGLLFADSIAELFI